MPKTMPEEELAEWRQELAAQWEAEDKANPQHGKVMLLVLRDARRKTLETMQGCYVYKTLDDEPTNCYSWVTESELDRAPWIEPRDIVYHTYEGWYDGPPLLLG